MKYSMNLLLWGNQIDDSLFPTLELIKEIGYWTPARDLYLIPSHDWQQRMYEKGKKMIATNKITVIAIPSSSRKNVYSDRSFTEHEACSLQLKDPDFRTNLLNRVIFDWGQKYYYDDKVYLKRFITGYLKKVLRHFGISTIELTYRIRFDKGEIIRKYRQRRGLK